MNSLRNKNQFPPYWSDLERNSIPQLHQILEELGVVPPEYADRDELIRLIRIRLTPRRQRENLLMQRDSDEFDPPTKNGDNQKDEFAVESDKVDEYVQIENDNDDFALTNNNYEYNDNDEIDNGYFPQPEPVLTPIESNNEFKEASSKLFPSSDKARNENNTRKEKPSENARKENKRYHGNVTRRTKNNEKEVNIKHQSPKPKSFKAPRLNKSQTNANFRMVGILFLIVSFVLLAVISLLGNKNEFTCPSHAKCDDHKILQCENGYSKVHSLCAPADRVHEYEKTFEAAKYVYNANANVQIDAISKQFPEANLTLLLDDPNFMVKLENENQLYSVRQK